MVKSIADLHMHGPIGFQDYWLSRQGYDKEKLLESILDVCFSNCYKENADIAICTLTSEEDKIPRNSIHDRLGYLIKNQLSLLPKDYHADTLGRKNNIIIAEKSGGNKKVFLVNSQTVRVLENGKKFDHLAIGANTVLNLISFEDTLKSVREMNLISVAEHPFSIRHFGIGKKRLEHYVTFFDAIEGHNSQQIIGKANQKAKEFAAKYKVPYIATSDAHMIEDAFLSYISFETRLNDTSEENFFSQLKNIIKNRDFEVKERYSKLRDWLRWIPKLWWGLTFDKEEISEDVLS